MKSFRSRPLLTSLAMAGLLLVSAPALAPARADGSVNLPSLGESASDELSVSAERQLGDRIMREIRRDPDVVDDPVLLDYVDSIFDRLVAAARARGDISDELRTRFAWEPFLVRDRTVNAFALPGGYLGVHLGLISMTTDADELASVLAHEMSHVTQRHIARELGISRRQSLIGLASMVLGILAASRSPDAANALITGGQAVSVQGQLNFSRDMEREADRVGFAVMTRAGFSPTGMAEMFEQLQNASKLNDYGGFPYLRTHPLTTERIGDARARAGIAATGGSLRPTSSADALMLHAAMQGRARGDMDLRAETLDRLVKGASDTSLQGTEGMVVAMSAAAAADNLRQWDAADTALARARTLAAGHSAALRAVTLQRVESLIERGQAQAALDTLRPSDGSRPELILTARAAAKLPPQSEVARHSVETLQTWVTLHAHDATAWTLLGTLYERANQPLPALRAQAEAQLALGDLTGAIDRFRAGQSMARKTNSMESVEAAVIDARLKEVEAEQRRLALDEQGKSKEP